MPEVCPIMKKILIRAGIVVVALLAAALLALYLNLSSLVKKAVETFGPEMTKVDVRLGSASLSPFSGGGELSLLFVGNPPGYSTPSAIRVGDIKVAVRLSSLMSDTIVVDEVSVRQPEITLEGSLTGNNLTKILDNINGSAGEAKKTGEAAPGAKKAGKKIIVKDLVIEGGKVNLSTPMLGGKSITVPLPPLHLQNLGSAENGVTPAELVQEVMKPLLGSVVQAGEAGLASALKDVTGLGKQGADQLKNAGKSISDLFKK
jgi:hypothetical protein